MLPIDTYELVMSAPSASVSMTDVIALPGGIATSNSDSVVPVTIVNDIAPVWKELEPSALIVALLVTVDDTGPQN